METLSATEPHYIRCVKPNNSLKPAIFENANVIQQLRCGVSILCLSACVKLLDDDALYSLKLLFFIKPSFLCFIGCS